MELEFVVALILGIPAILFPVALVWYLNIGGLYKVIQKLWWKRVFYTKGRRAGEEEQYNEAQPVVIKH